MAVSILCLMLKILIFGYPQLREKVRLNKVLNKDQSLGIIDSQSVKWINNRSLNGFDVNKKVKRIKRHVKGFLLSISASQVYEGNIYLDLEIKLCFTEILPNLVVSH